MKSQLFYHMYSGSFRFHHKEYNRYLKNEINDRTLVPLDPDEIDFDQLDVKVEKEQKGIARKKINRRRKKQTHQSFTEISFEYYWDQLPTHIISTLMSFLGHSGCVSLMGACRATYKVLHSKVWEYLIEKELYVRLEGREICPNLEYLRSFSKSLYYSLNPKDILSSQTLLSVPHEETRILAYHLVDFISIKNKTMKTKLRSFVPNYLTGAFLLSVDDKENKVTLWFVENQKGRIMRYIISMLSFGQDETEVILSAKFCTDNFIIIQTKKTIIEEGTQKEVLNVSIIDIPKEIGRFDGEVDDTSSLQHFSLSYTLNTALEGIQILNQASNKLEVQGTPISKLSVCFESKERLIFYEGTMIFLYSVRNNKIDHIYTGKSFQDIVEIFIPKLPETEESIDHRFFYINKTNQIFVLIKELETDHVNKEITYTEEEEEKEEINSYIDKSEKGTKIYQYGNITDKEGNIMDEYLILKKNGDFYCIDLKTTKFRKVISREFIAGPISSWCTYDGLVAIVHDQYYLAVYKYDPVFHFAKLVSTNLFLENSLGRNGMKRLFTKHSDLIRSMIPPRVVMNHSYIILFNFPYTSSNFQIYFLPLAEVLKPVQTWDLNSGLTLNQLKVKWDVKSGEVYWNADQIYYNIERRPELYNEIIKFEDNKILINLQNRHLFIDLQCPLNFVRFTTHRRSSHIASFDLKLFEVNFSEEYRSRDKRKVLSKDIKLYNKLFPNMNQPIETGKIMEKETEENEKQIGTELTNYLEMKRKYGIYDPHIERKIRKGEIHKFFSDKEANNFQGVWFEYIDDFKRKTYMKNLLNKQKTMKKKEYEKNNDLSLY